MNIEYREIDDSEIIFLEEMLYESLFVPAGGEKYPPSILRRPEINRYIKDWGNLPLDIAFVAVVNDELTGAVWGRAFQPPDTGYGFIDEHTPEISIAVMEEYRNRRIGARLLETIFGYYRGCGVKSVSLAVDKMNPAKNLYLRAGFKTVAENNTDFIMKKDLE